MTFTLEFVMKTTLSQKHILAKRFDIEKKIYNIVLSDIIKRVEEMHRTRRYRFAKKDHTPSGELTSFAKSELKKLRKEYRLSSVHDFEKDIKRHRKFYKDNIDSQAGQKIAARLWEAFEKIEFGDGEEFHFKRKNDLRTIQGKSNKTGIRLVERPNGNFSIEWNGLSIPLKVKTDYENDALKSNPICYCMIKRRPYPDGYKYYAVVVFDGQRPWKYDKYTGVIKRQMGKGRVGLDIGVSTLAVASEKTVEMHELAPSAQKWSDKLRRIQRAKDRSMRKMNPHNYNSDGTIKKGAKQWRCSNRCKKLLSSERFIYSKLANIREYEHHLLKNHVLSLGDEFYVELMNFHKLQERVEETQEDGSIHKKKHHGRSIGHRAPAKLLSFLEYAISAAGGTYTKINTYDARASQFNHDTETFKKKKLHQRWNHIQGKKIQRDLYSAFLIAHINDDLSTFNLEGCREDYPKFKELHDLAVAELLNNQRFQNLWVL